MGYFSLQFKLDTKNESMWFHEKNYKQFRASLNHISVLLVNYFNKINPLPANVENMASSE